MGLKRRMRAVRHTITRKIAGLLPQGGADFARQFLVLFGCYVAYSLVRALTRGREVTAFANARHIMNAEKALHIYVEPWLQAKVSHVEILLRFFNFFYTEAHLPITIGCLIWIYIRRNDVFAFFRNWFLVLNGIAVTCFALVPTAPPRLLPTSGIVDTLYLLSSTNFQTGPISWLVNPFAAVPSLHIGYAMFVAMSVFMLARTRVMRVLAVLYPAVVLVEVIVTGNHFFFDTLAGALTACVAYLFTLNVSAVGAGDLLPASWREARHQ